MKSVLVTGANGHVGYNIVALLSRKGYKVRAGVRGAGDPLKVKPLRDLGVDIIELDIMKPDTLRQAMKGVDGVFQVAAVYQLVSKNPQTDIIDPAVIGGLNVLEAAHAAKVKKVIFTSSTAAIGTNAPSGRDLDESDWNDEAVEPYLVAKTQAEHKAWDFAEKSGLNLVCINPSGIIGPGFYRHTPTTTMFEMTLRQKIPVCVPFGFCYVDVRDVAEAHVLAFENKKAQGRYIAADGFYKMSDLMKITTEIMPGLKVPTRTLPPALMPAALLFDWLGNVIAGAPRQLSKAVIDEYTNSEQRVSSERARRELGW
ncbi:MAG: NAD-dependent epimerase/dehydratase family protein, partial [Spirochaetia bacterium]|nr:NAD-dependent epimerase/dehydratase family protein [Spirochaetia bacterium]